MTTLSVVIPAYNEEDGITAIVERVLAVKPELAKVGIDELELIVVNDGSKDRTAQVVSGIAGVTLINHPVNRGYGAALKTGFSSARGELVGFLDADGTYPPEYFPQLCQRALDDAELVIGSRMAGEASQMPITRRIGNIFFANLLSLVSRHRVTDSASGMRVFRKEVIQRIYPLPDGLNLTPIMSTRAIHEGIKVVEVPIPYSERVGRSKLSVVRDGTIFLKSILWTALTYNPVRILGMIGLVGMAISAVIFTHFVIQRLSGNTSDIAGGNLVLLFAGLIAGGIGVNIFLLGVAFNYLVSIFVKRPVRHGLFGRALFRQPLDKQFGWLGSLAILMGVGIGIFAAVFSGGWSIARQWLYLLGSANLVLLGVQLVIYWIILQVLDELGNREIMTQKDLTTLEPSQPVNPQTGEASAST